jgi:hypothetical protein
VYTWSPLPSFRLASAALLLVAAAPVTALPLASCDGDSGVATCAELVLEVLGEEVLLLLVLVLVAA